MVTSSILSGFAKAGGAVRDAAAKQRSKRATERAVDQLDIGDKPKAAEYKPVDFSGEQLATIQQNIHNLNAANDLSKWTNADITQNDITRASTLIPGYKQLMQQLGADAAPLLKGELPYEDVLGIVGNRANQVGGINIAGTAGPATARDLGISRLDAINQGKGLMQSMVQTAEQVSPVGRQVTPAQSFVSPLDRIRLAMEQNQTIQQSDQNKYNIEASVSPTQYAQQILGLGLAGQDTRTNWENVVATGLGGITSGLGGMGGGGGGAPAAGGGGGGNFLSGLSGLFGGGGTAPAGGQNLFIPASTYNTWRPGPQSGTQYMPSSYSIPA